MPIGRSSKSEPIARPAMDVFVDLQKAWGIIGTVTDANTQTFTLKGKSKYGADTVDMKAVIAEVGGNSRIDIDAMSNDIWGYGAKNVIDRLLESLHNLDNPDYSPSKTGMTPRRLALTIGAVVVLVFLVLGLITTTKPASMAGVLVFLAILVGIVQVSRARFRKR